MFLSTLLLQRILDIQQDSTYISLCSETFTLNVPWKKAYSSIHILVEKSYWPIGKVTDFSTVFYERYRWIILIEFYCISRDWRSVNSLVTQHIYILIILQNCYSTFSCFFIISSNFIVANYLLLYLLLNEISDTVYTVTLNRQCGNFKKLSIYFNFYSKMIFRIVHWESVLNVYGIITLKRAFIHNIKE